MSLKIVRTVAQLREQVAEWKQQGLRVAVVPTMGALHEGHASLIKEGLERADRVIVTLFVNPKQFNNAGDLVAYPRNESGDAQTLAKIGAHLLYAPALEEIYPAGFATTVSVRGVSEGLCGGARPGHFDGVATVVTKLFTQTGADIALFGEKDYQQLMVVRRLVRDLDLPIEIIACKTLREPSGLAMSSRNLRLTADQLAIAPALARILFKTSARLSALEDVPSTLEQAKQAILSVGFTQIDYLELRSADALEPMEKFDRDARLLVAAWLGDIRLIDSIEVKQV